LFKGAELGNYQILSLSPAAKSGMELPPEIAKLLGQTKKEARFVGAFPPQLP
jgi:hypothetical protein